MTIKASQIRKLIKKLESRNDAKSQIYLKKLSKYLNANQQGLQFLNESFMAGSDDSVSANKNFFADDNYDYNLDLTSAQEVELQNIIDDVKKMFGDKW